jgi:hypothetical protein
MWRRWGLLCGALGAVLAAAVVSGLVSGSIHTGAVDEWHWDKPAHVDGRTIHLTFDGSNCDDKRWVDVDETRETVTLTVKIRERTGTCAGVGLGGLSLDAELDEPLGDRTLIDGACQGGDEPRRGNCPAPVQTGTCGSADYRVDMPVDDDGNVTLRVQVDHAVPGESWRFRWTFKDYYHSRVDRSEVDADGDGRLVAMRQMGAVSDFKSRRVEFASVGGTACEVKGHMPMSYGA